MVLIKCLTNGDLLSAQHGSIASVQAVVRLKHGHFFLRTGELGRALIWIYRALSVHKYYAEALHVLGMVHFRQKFFKEACKDWKQAGELQTEWCQGLEYSRVHEVCP